MKSLDLFLPRVTPYVLDATEPMARQALVDAAIEFCLRTNAVYTITTANATANLGEYDIEEPTGMETVRVQDVYYGRTKLRPVDTAAVDEPLSLRGAVDGESPVVGTPVAFYALAGTNTFTVYPLPETTTAGMFTVKASFAPTRTATQLDDLLYDRYLDAIASGAIANLVAVPGQRFTSAGGYALHRERFERGVSRALAEARKGAAVTSTRVQPRSFA